MATSGLLHDDLTIDSLDMLLEALYEAVGAEVTTRAYGARIAAERLTNAFG